MKKIDEKLTLKLRRDAIAKAKKYAKSKGTSLSRLVEGYFYEVAEPAPGLLDEPSELVRSLSGIISQERDTDLKKGYYEYLGRKYGLK